MKNHLWLYPNLVSVRKSTCSQQELSEQIGIPQQEISRYERGEIKAPVNYLIDVANVCNVSVDYILGRSDKGTNILTKEEIDILMVFRALSNENRNRLLERAVVLLETQSDV